MKAEGTEQGVRKARAEYQKADLFFRAALIKSRVVRAWKARFGRPGAVYLILHPSSFILPLLAAALIAGCRAEEPVTAVPGDPKAGRAALKRYQCGACHSIPGIAGAHGRVGPPLTEYAQRVYIAGKFPNEPALLARWIQDAPSLVPQTAMPNVGVSDADARDIAAYLYQLR